MKIFTRHTDYCLLITEETGSDPQSLNQGSDLEQHVFTEDQRQRNAAEFSHTTESSEVQMFSQSKPVTNVPEVLFVISPERRTHWYIYIDFDPT